MFRFAIRDVLLVMVIVGLAVGWWVDHQRLDTKARMAEASKWEHYYHLWDVAKLWADEVQHDVTFTIPGGKKILVPNPGVASPVPVPRP